MAKTGRLILSRKVGEKIYIGDDITITVVSIGNKGPWGEGLGRIRLSVDAPKGTLILREELLQGRGDDAAKPQGEQDAPH